MAQPPAADFAIQIDFEKGVGSPARVFRAMSNLIEAFNEVDKKLVQCVDTKIQPVLLLEDVEASSLKAWLRHVLTAIDDNALKDLNWKKQVGGFLVKGKYLLVDFLRENTTVTNRAQISGLSQKLLAASEHTDVKHIPSYSPMPEAEIVESLTILTEATSMLEQNDRVTYATSEQESRFNLEFSVSPETVEEILTKETLEHDQVMILKVKQPDYLGESMWDFRYQGRPLQAKITHVEWLTDFQKRKINVRPGDALKADVHVVAKYGFDGEVVDIHYTASRINEVIQAEPTEPSGHGES